MTLQEQNTILVYRVKPEGFSPSVEVAACYVQVGDQFLFLKRSNHKHEGGKWGVPAGKIEKNESAFEAVKRETCEETGIVLDDDKLKGVGKLYIRKPGIDYVYHMYYTSLENTPEVHLSADEHQEHKWLEIDALQSVPLMDGAIEAIYHLKTLACTEQLPRKPFYFIRHGETDANVDMDTKRVDIDLPLNDRGKNQARSAQKLHTNLSLSSVCYSPIQRAVETKDILVSALKLEQFELEDLSECKAHIWTKMVRIEEGSGYHACHEVENFIQRAMRGLVTALKQDSPTLVVAHGGIHWALCYYLAIEGHPWKIGNCELVHFRPNGNKGWEAELIS